MPNLLPSSLIQNSPSVNEMEDWMRETVISGRRRSMSGHLPMRTSRSLGVRSMKVRDATVGLRSCSRRRKGYLGHWNSTRKCFFVEICILLGKGCLHSSHSRREREYVQTSLFSDLRTLLWIHVWRQEKWTYWQLPLHEHGVIRSSPPSERQNLQETSSEPAAGEYSPSFSSKNAS